MREQQLQLQAAGAISIEGKIYPAIGRLNETVYLKWEGAAMNIATCKAEEHWLKLDVFINDILLNAEVLYTKVKFLTDADTSTSTKKV